ncbi:LytR/AlgR family response regulator transcription factor [Clostridium nigeriense]|uniref:LytR/AlgR family response regulator transcription factor n=1 Tax=Clostridium nigeriense TaxID=1805470 RepID=UPI003D348576
MFQICICDDNTDFLLSLNNKLCKIATKNNLEVNIIKYSSAKQLLFDLDDHRNNIDIYFLDVLIDDLTGIDIANKIRKFSLTSQIIFLTSSKEHVFDALDMMPLHYLLKQELNNDKLEAVFIKAINLIQPSKKNLFYYKVGHTIKCINTNKIVFFEIKNRIVTMMSTDGSTEQFYFTMKDLVKQINNDNFIQIHRSFLINAYYIKSIDTGSLISYNDIILPIGDKYIKNLKKQYTKFLLNDLNNI